MNDYYEKIDVCTAFAGASLVASGHPRQVVAEIKAYAERTGDAVPVLTFDDATGRPVEFDLRGTLDEAVARVPEAAVTVASSDSPRRPGRPKLGVVAREVTLLPRHWEWLASQPGGASVTLRKLVDGARKGSADEDRVRLARDAAYRVMFALAGNEAGFEEASRALFAGNAEDFSAHTREWPEDVRAYALHLAEPSFTQTTED